MIKVILGPKGMGKTKTMLDLSCDAVTKENGAIVFIEKGNKLIHEVARKIRLVDTDEYGIKGFCKFYGFLCGMAAANYDISHIFIDSIFKIVENDDMDEFAKFLCEVEKLASNEDISFTVSVSAEIESATNAVKKYM